jgi:hypothetical protein
MSQRKSPFTIILPAPYVPRTAEEAAENMKKLVEYARHNPWDEGFCAMHGTVPGEIPIYSNPDMLTSNPGVVTVRIAKSAVSDMRRSHNYGETDLQCVAFMARDAKLPPPYEIRELRLAFFVRTCNDWVGLARAR